MNYFEFVCTTSSAEIAEILTIHFSDIGFESFVDTDTGFNAYIQEVLYNSETEPAIQSLQTKYPFQYKVQFIKNQNWNKQWEENFSPINVDNKCYVRASFHPPLEGLKYDIIINPKMSFGTAHHETTFMVISQLIKCDVKNKTVCDMGCGTSVLAILASKMGAVSVLAIDTDDWAVENSIENINTNNTSGVVVKKGDAQLLVGKTFHIILANINRNVLLSDMEKYIRSLNKQGILILSGFFDVDINLIESKAKQFGMDLLNTKLKNKWAMLCFIKNM